MKTGNNRKLFIGIGIGVTLAVILESGVIYGFVGATASMGALGLLALTGLIGYASAKILLRVYKRRRIKMLLRKSNYVEFSDDGYLQFDNDYEPYNAKPISEKDKKVIVDHIDEIMHRLSNTESETSDTVKALITAKDKKTIMEHIDEILAVGPEYSG